MKLLPLLIIGVIYLAGALLVPVQGDFLWLWIFTGVTGAAAIVISIIVNVMNRGVRTNEEMIADKEAYDRLSISQGWHQK